MLCLTVCSLVTILTLCVHRRSAPSPASPHARPSAPALTAGARVTQRPGPAPAPLPPATPAGPPPCPPADPPYLAPSPLPRNGNSPHLCFSFPLQIRNIFESFPHNTSPRHPRRPGPGVTIINSAQKSEVVTRKTFQR